jgi:hypothetical protein
MLWDFLNAAKILPMNGHVKRLDRTPVLPVHIRVEEASFNAGLSASAYRFASSRIQ